MPNEPRSAVPRTRILLSLTAALIVTLGAAFSGGVAQGRVDPGPGAPLAAVMSPDTQAKVTGGGTVTVTGIPNVVASFGLNGKRPSGFVQNGQGVAQGRINYDKHAQVANRHVNVPVTFMNVELSATPTQNGTGGKAQLVGDCTAPGAECPQTIQSVLVYVEDNSDSGTGDVFNISYCLGAASANTAALQCGPAEGGTLRTGNLQIRAALTGSGGTAPTAMRAPLRIP